MQLTQHTVYPARPGPRPFTAEALWRIPRVGDPVPAQDGSAVAVTVTTHDLEKNEGRGRIWILQADGGPARPLTAPEWSSGAPAFAPDGRQLAFTCKNDTGKAQLHLMPVDGGEDRRVTDMPLGVFDPKWLPGGDGVVFGAMVLKGHATAAATAAELERRERDPVKAHVTEERFYRYWDSWLTTGEVPHLFLYDTSTDSVRDLTPESTVWFDWMEPAGQYDVAPDGREVAFAGIWFDDERSLIRSAVYMVPLHGGQVECLTPDLFDSLQPRFSPDGRSLVFGLQRDPYFYADRVRLWQCDRETRKNRPLLDDWEFSAAAWRFAPDGSLVIEAERHGRGDLFVLRRGEAVPSAITDRGTVHGAVALAERDIVFTRQTLSEPAEVWRVGVDGSGLRRLSSFTDAATREFSLGEVREMTFEGASGETVQMFVVLPPDADVNAVHPLVHVIHGGPHGISGDQFHPRWNAQLFAAPGYLVALVNFQGSTSWSETFTRSILGAWGDRPFEDVMRATDVLVEGGMVDARRMAAAGGSYGGYMAAWIAGHTDRFRCIVNHAGVYDTLAQYATDVTQGRQLSFGGEPWSGLDVIDRWNPARFASGFNTPMLVIHGERDYRVPATQGLECYGVLKAKGIPARLVYFPDENHWVLKPRNSLLWYREVLGWLERFLA